MHAMLANVFPDENPYDELENVARDAASPLLLLDDPDFLKGIVQKALQRILEAEMTAHLGAAPHERTEDRRGHRNGYKPPGP